jgi:hypothetical protein
MLVMSHACAVERAGGGPGVARPDVVHAGVRAEVTRPKGMEQGPMVSRRQVRRTAGQREGTGWGLMSASVTCIRHHI